jgi:heptosyltransferase-2
MRILVFRGGALGDFLVTLPALGLLRARWPKARVAWVGNPAAAELGRLGGYLDAVYSQHEARWSALFAGTPLPGDLASWLAEFDLVLNYWPDADGALARRFPVRAGQTYLSAAAHPHIAPAARYYCEPLRALGLATDGFHSRLDVARVVPEARFASPQPSDGGQRLADKSPYPIAIHPGSGSPRKNWPVERWIDLIQRLTQPILLVLGEAEQESLPTWRNLCAHSTNSGPRMYRGAGDQRPRIQLASSLPLPDLATTLSRCRLFLGHDSGVSHLAAAVGTPCLLLFGPTDPAMWAPPGEQVRVLRRGGSLEAITVDEVAALTFLFCPG